MAKFTTASFACRSSAELASTLAITCTADRTSGISMLVGVALRVALIDAPGLKCVWPIVVAK